MCFGLGATPLLHMPKQASGHESDAKDVGAKALSAHYICITSFSHGLNINEAFRGVGTICNVWY